MAKLSKATKKFQTKHLKHTIDHRREVQKHNRKVSSHKKKRAGDKTEEANGAEAKKSKEVFNDMSVEDFFAGGFEVPKEKKSKKNAVPAPQEDDESSSDEEDVEQSMKNLEQNDPDFFKYLKNNDKGLLDFSPINPLDAISDDEEEEEEQEAKPKAKKAAVKEEAEDKIEVTIALVKKWNTDLEKPSVKLIKNVVMAFKASVNINSDEEYKYSITDPKAFNDLMKLALSKLPKAVQILIKYKTNANGQRSIPQNNKNLQPVQAAMKSHAASIISLLKDINNVDTAAFVLSSLQEIFPYYLSYRRLIKEILQAVITLWSTTKEIEIQIASFAFLSNVSKEFSKSILETVLKLSYSSFIKTCRKTNVHNMPLINFQKNSCSELFGIDQSLSYQIGFEYVRQLAIHLRNSLSATSNAKEGYKTIYNWQYIHSLDFWSRVLSSHCNSARDGKKESPLTQLIYPLVQVTLGCIRLIPTAQFFPLRFYLIRSLIRLSQTTGVFIPIYPLLNEILNSTTITKNPKKDKNLQAVDFDNNIKVNQAYLGTKTFQDGVTEQFVELLSEFLVLYCKNIAFPELATPIIINLRRFIKTSKNVRFNKQLGQLIEKLNANVKLINEKRANVEFGPTNKVEVAQFLKEFDWEKAPLGAYVSVQRQIKEEKMRILRESLEEDEKERQAKKNADEDESDIEMSEGEESEEDEE